MASQHLYSFQELMTQGVLDPSNNYQQVSLLRVPRIQRSYAQGRESESDIREKFLGDIFSSLNSGTPLEMSFVYGSFDNGVFDVLDGQQRLTTLFLVHWYTLMMEGQPYNWLENFAYQTRKTSTDFIEKLISDTFDFSKEKPSQNIKDKKWFVLSFKQDSTIMSMLNMLDAIHEKYSVKSKPLASNLNLLNFYLIPLDQYGLTEDLYIKMNARGLRLNPFDDFKADVVNYLRNNSNLYASKSLPIGSRINRMVPYHLYFSTNLDNSWIDLFWKLDKKNYDKLFFRFFYRYMSSKYITDIQPSMVYDNMKDDPDYLFFAEVSEAQIDRYKGFKLYEKYLNPTVIMNIEKILDILKGHYQSDIKPQLTSPWGDNGFMFDEPGPQKFNRKSQVIFTAVIEYLERCTPQNFDVKDFGRWMRVVWNIVENSNIDGLRPQMAVMLRFVDMLNQGIVGDVYAGLSIYSVPTMSAAAREEVDKAKLIQRPGTSWESHLIKAEKDLFLKGMVSFFCDDFSAGFSETEFDARYRLVSQMFDKDGITNSFRQQHLLLRALLSCINGWNGADGMKDLRFTERVESNTFLKNMIRQRYSVWQVFNIILSNASSLTIDDVKDRLIQELNKRQCNASALPIDDGNTVRPGQPAFDKAYNKLINDTNLLDWISFVESEQDKYFKIYYAYFHIWVTIPGAQYARVMLDSNRDVLIDNLWKLQKFNYEDNNQKQVFDQYGLHFGFDVALSKTHNSREILVVFQWNNTLSVGVKFNDPADFTSLSSTFGTTKVINDNYLEVLSRNYNSLTWNDLNCDINNVQSKI